MKPIKKITLSHTVGIWTKDLTIRIYDEIVTINCPVVKWKNSTGTLSFKRYTIRNPEDVAAIKKQQNEDTGYFKTLIINLVESIQFEEDYRKYA